MSDKAKLPGKKGKNRDQMLAELGLSSVVANTATACMFAKGRAGELDFIESLKVMLKNAREAQAGDLSGQEATLAAQAATLDTMFNELARRAVMNIGEYLPAAEVYLRLALKAQSQCRATIETLAVIKNPPVVYARQANIANGPQQINNGIPTRTREIENEQTKLSGNGNELLPHAGAPGLTGRVNQKVETVGTLDRATISRG